MKLKEKMISLKIKLLNKFVASDDEYYSLTAPSEEYMRKNNKTFWIQPCFENDEEVIK